MTIESRHKLNLGGRTRLERVDFARERRLAMFDDGLTISESCCRRLRFASATRNRTVRAGY